MAETAAIKEIDNRLRLRAYKENKVCPLQGKGKHVTFEE